MRMLPLVVALGGCLISRHPQQPTSLTTLDTTGSPDWDALLTEAGPIQHEAVASAYWMTKLSGLVNLDDPKAAAFDKKQDVRIVLPVHALSHPSKGLYVVDTGIDSELAAGETGPARGLAKGALKTMEPVESLASIVARQGQPLAGVLITHTHIDHVLGLRDVPDAPVYVGPGELQSHSLTNAALVPTMKQLLDARAPLEIWPTDGEARLEGLVAIDVLGDETLWALHVPGHTPGSMAYLARTTTGPQLFVGDTSHTLWGWENGVIPGGFTEEPDANQQSLDALRRLVERFEMPVWMGHELDGEGTGI
ncbi:MAG: MBL fold metallo-hydrolase [Proteobacteria bacterium]|nr:MBL fold metallo-hydrolase [Pseudomonadota bacterium]